MTYNDKTVAELQRCIREDAIRLSQPERARTDEVECLRVQVIEYKRKIRQQNDTLFVLRRWLIELGVDEAELREAIGEEVKEQNHEPGDE